MFATDNNYYVCPYCNGHGVETSRVFVSFEEMTLNANPCPACDGVGTFQIGGGLAFSSVALSASLMGAIL
jgi:DnaJ-class molecular chaperone